MIQMQQRGKVGEGVGLLPHVFMYLTTLGGIYELFVFHIYLIVSAMEVLSCRFHLILMIFQEMMMLFLRIP